MKRVVSGIVILGFGLLGMYCSMRALQVYRGLNGRPDINDSARNWSTGAMACFVACAVVSTLSRKKAVAAGRPPSRWWKTPVGITLLAVAVIVAMVVIVRVLQPPPRAVSPMVAPSPRPPPPEEKKEKS
jgi:hypothetical protein